MLAKFRLAPALAVIALTLAASPSFAFDIAFQNDGTYVTGVGSYDVKVADVNQDGRPDILCAIADGKKVTVLLNSGGAFPTIRNFPGGTAVAIDVGDYDGDGLPDVVSADWFENRITLRRNLGGGTFDIGTTYPMGNTPRDVVGADLDGDGWRDVAVATGAGTVHVRAGLGPSGLSPTLQSLSPGGILKGIDAGDLDHDGKIDLMVVDSQGHRAIPLHNDGGLVFTQMAALPMGVGASDIALRDLDGDGWVDVAVANEDGTVSVARNLQDGTFAPRSNYNVGHFSQSIAVADMDNDGIPDLLCSDYTESTFHVLPGLGNFQFGAAVIGQSSGGVRSAAAGDFNGDGRPDVATGDFNTGTVHVFRNGSPYQHAVLDTPSLNFGVAPQTVTSSGVARVSNLGTATLVVTPGAIDGPEFSLLSSATPVNVVPGSSVSFTIQYARAAMGPAVGTFHFTTNDSLLPAGEVALSGVAQGLPYPHAVQITTNLDFGSAPQSTPTTLNARVNNTGTATLVVQPAGFDGTQFVLAQPSTPVNVAPGSFVVFPIQYTRTTIGSAVGTFHFTTNDSLLPAGQVALSGFAQGPPYPHAVVVNSSLDFGSAVQGQIQSLTARVDNIGNATLIVQSGATDGADFNLVGPVGTSNVAPGGFVTFTLRYTRSTLGPAVGAFHFTTNDTLLSAGVIALSGSATGPPLVSASAPPPMFLAVGGQGNAEMHLRNVGTGPLHLTIQPDPVDLSETHPDDLGPTSVFPILRADQSGANWDIDGKGGVVSGSGSSYNGGMVLTNFLPQAETMIALGGREMRLGPALAPNGALLTRKIYIPVDGSFARYVDELKNPSEQAKTFTMDYIDNSGFALAGPIRTSSGDTQFALDDDWLALPPDTSPDRRSVARVFQTVGAPNEPTGAVHGSGGFPAGDYSRTTFGVTVAPHATASIIQWAIQGIDIDDAQATATALRLGPASAFEFTDAIDRSTSWNVARGAPVFQPTAPTLTLTIAPGDSALINVVYDAGSATRDAIIQGALRVTTDDLGNPVVYVPLELHVTGGRVVGVDPGAGPVAGGALALAGLVPNPARLGGAGHIAYRLPNSESATITLYDVRGRVLARHTLEHPSPGPGAIELGAFERGQMRAGVVWLRLVQGGHAVTQKGILLP